VVNRIRIGVCGYATSGKDVVASALVEHRGFVRLNMSDPLMRDLSVMDPLVDVAGNAHRLSTLLNRHSFDELKAVSTDFRQLLQRYGTDVWRTVDEDTWVRRVEQEAARYERVVTTGIRFANELRGIDVLVHVSRPGVGPVNGPVSDAGISAITRLADYHLHNDGSIEDLERATLVLADSLLGGE